jgi:hypothetical protein
MDKTSNQITISQLCEKGDPRITIGWRKGNPDYVGDFGLLPEHIPSLIEIVRMTTESDELAEDEWGAPIHAWRALGQLRAVEAVELLLNVQNRLDELGDDWYLEEFHDVFGLIGPPAVDALSEYLADRNNREFPRVSTANGLCEIGKRHPETRAHIVGVLTEQLAKHESEIYHLNAFLIAYLTDLKASESAEVIERAFAANLVDETVCGDWADIREELSVAGLGLVSDRPCPPKPHLGFAGGLGDSLPVDRLDRDRQRQSDKRAKAKRKQQKQARKRNRKHR